MTCARCWLSFALIVALAAPALGERATGDRPAALADSAVPDGGPRAAAVAIMRDSGQALLWDAARGEYLLVKAGDHFRGFFVTTIGDAAVVVAADRDPKQRHVLRLAPAPTSRPGRGRSLRPTVITLAPSEAGGAALELVDPYPADGLEVVDPYGAAPGQTVMTPATPAASGRRPSGPRDPGVRAVRAPGASAIGVPPVASPRWPAAAPAVAGARETSTERTAPKAGRAPARRVERTVEITREELDAALSDFDALGREIQVERATGGGVRVIGLSRGSFFHRTGVRQHDVIRAVAGVRLTTLESAAVVYARVQASDRFEVEIERGKTRVILTYAIR